jgi:hypothetical protein
MRCPGCLDHLDGELTVCAGCGVARHRECARELGGCPTLGCAGLAGASGPATGTVIASALFSVGLCLLAPGLATAGLVELIRTRDLGPWALLALTTALPLAPAVIVGWRNLRALATTRAQLRAPRRRAHLVVTEVGVAEAKSLAFVLVCAGAADRRAELVTGGAVPAGTLAGWLRGDGDDGPWLFEDASGRTLVLRPEDDWEG